MRNITFTIPELLDLQKAVCAYCVDELGYDEATPRSLTICETWIDFDFDVKDDFQSEIDDREKRVDHGFQSFTFFFNDHDEGNSIEALADYVWKEVRKLRSREMRELSVMARAIPSGLFNGTSITSALAKQFAEEMRKSFEPIQLRLESLS